MTLRNRSPLRRLTTGQLAGLTAVALLLTAAPQPASAAPDPAGSDAPGGATGAPAASAQPLGAAVQQALTRDGAGAPAEPGGDLPTSGDGPPQTRITASDGTANDVFGTSVSVDGDTALVGSVLSDVDGITDQGAAYVFVRAGDSWHEQAKLTASDGAAGDQFGFSSFLDGDTAVVSAPSADVDGRSGQGAAWVFTRDGDSWTEQGKLVASDGAAGDQFGISATVHGDTALVGGWFAGVGGAAEQGAAWVFTRDGDSWTEQARLTSADGVAGDRFGYAVTVVDDTAVVGAIDAAVGGNGSQGAAYTFTRAGGAWQQQARLVAPDGADGSQFGIAVDLAATGDRVLVGAPATTVDGDAFRGAAYEFRRDGGQWSGQARLTVPDGAEFDQLGWSVRLDGDAALLSAPGFNNLQGTGYVYTRDGDGWEQAATLTAADGEPFAEFGFSVSLDGDTALLGASRAMVDGNFDQGAAYAFTLDRPGDDPGPVACDETITGVHPGPLTVTEGVTCLAAGAHVLGQVNVADGAGLRATAAVVQGPVSAIGAVLVDMAFTQVTGPVLVSGADGQVSLLGSQVTGSVSLVGNLTPQPAVVAGNTVIGSLVCSGNDPAPTDSGLPNTATAGTFGQCADL